MSNTVRITSGIYKNRKLAVPKSAHPMGERERTAIFNSLSDISNLSVLDMFAGSGALGIEALSRGASAATFVDNDREARELIKRNAPAPVTVLPQLPEERSYDLIFADPPYDNPQLDQLPEIAKRLRHGGTLVLSLPKQLAPPELPNLRQISVKSYANAQIIMYN